MRTQIDQFACYNSNILQHIPQTSLAEVSTNNWMREFAFFQYPGTDFGFNMCP